MTPQELGAFLKRGDIALAMGILTILVVLIVPLPPMILDLLLAFSIILAVLILMTALFIAAPLEFSSFPTILLIATMLRLSLNLASTRLILQNGHTGQGAAGHVIEAFGNFVMGGNFVIGVIVFVILVIVNFVVITKGSSRIAEVAARFSLDAMPGKQMAIDADLSAGLIDQDEAKARRKALEDESAFFGAMDGASKFVRGDAIAGILITFINVVGGIIIGVAQNGMTFNDAAKAYTLLTVGDGLVTQIPALIVSTAAGLLVSKAGVTGAADKALSKQLASSSKALGMSSFVMVVIAILPGMPAIPFLGLALLAGYMAWRLDRQEKQANIDAAAEQAMEQVVAQQKASDPPVQEALRLDELRIEIGYALLPLVQGQNGEDKITEQIKALRRTLATEMGFILPSVRLVDNVQLESNHYVIKMKEIDAGNGVVFPNQYMAMDPAGEQVQLPGAHMLEPTFGLPATWIDESLRDEAQLRGYTVVDPATVIATHLTEIIKNNMSELLSYAEVQKLLKDLSKPHQDLVKDLTGGAITITGIQRILQLLLAERVSIRDLGTILEAVAEVAGTVTRDPRMIVEHIRSRLGRQICAQHTGPTGQLALITLSPSWEDAFASSLVGDGEIKHLAMQPSRLHDFVIALRDRFEEAARLGELPVLVTSNAVRPYVRMIVERFRPQTAVLAQGEIHPSARLRTVGSI
ncbi:flagellar biosynthesis protein FlhA [Rhabdaerophilum sp. SD176]|uniref:flagellar biosynthesis protein FlhA n=1 Tax=Rhabdaerophilum sp. SD176 TaxID=2983548 RepID=UPI0024DF3EFA|nr:flagellar biosynthesis protein FlhA [Rhabdaerophilum sp. SD176]